MASQIKPDTGIEREPAERKLSVNRDDAAKYLRDTYGIRSSRQTLAKKAVTGGGPRFRKAGRTPIYDIQELDRWALDHIGPLQDSTSTLRDLPRRESEPQTAMPDALRRGVERRPSS